MGQTVQPQEAKAAIAQFESGHVCRVCESHIVKLPGGEIHWCPTCGAETHGPVSDICTCGSKVGKHDALLRCTPVDKWADEPNTLIRRKVLVGAKAATVQAAKPRQAAGALFDGGDE